MSACSRSVHKREGVAPKKLKSGTDTKLAPPLWKASRAGLNELVLTLPMEGADVNYTRTKVGATSLIAASEIVGDS